MHNLLRKGALAMVAAGCLVTAVVGSQAVASAGTPPTFDLKQVGAFGGEPSITSDSNGVLYDTSPSGLPSTAPQYPGEPPIYRSTDKGETWTLIEPADTNSGDDCLATDESNALYWCNLGSSTQSTAPLQADTWKTTVPTTCVASCSWAPGLGILPTACGTSCSFFGVDRMWDAASIVPPATTTAGAEVVMMYHDFYGPSSIWVNLSTNGGATFGAAMNIFAGLPVGAAGAGSVEAEGYTFCNSVPSGAGIVKQKLPDGSPNPHAGRVYVAWIASDPVSDAAGCNVSMAQAFHTLWVAYSDNITAATPTWTVQEVADIGLGHDASTPFAAFTLDNQGNPYMAFNAMDAASSTNVATCAADAATDAEQGDPTCDFKTYVAWCQCGGSSVTFDGGGGTIPGSAAAPYEVDPGIRGTGVFTTIAAGNPGMVDVGWLQTPEVDPTDADGKFYPGGCAGTAANTPVPATATPCQWNLWEGQSLDLTNAPGSEHWVTSQLTSTPMHVGDICNLGIACAGNSDRSLLDFNQETVDPTTGCAHIAYADNNGPDGTFSTTTPSPNDNHLVAANQLSGPNILGLTTGPCAGTVNPVVPEAPWTVLFVPAGAILLGLSWKARRRSMRTA